MRLPRPTKPFLALSVVVATVATAAPAASGSKPGTLPDDRTPPAAGRAAERALDAVSEAFDRGTSREPEGRDLTLLLVDLAQGVESLAPAERQVARGYLARPTDSAADPYGDGYQADAVIESACTTDICVTWDDNPDNRDAPPGAGRAGRPTQVSKTQDVLDRVWTSVVDQGGYRAPLPDAGQAGDAGPGTQFDVYLADIGDGGLYGYCAPDSGRRTSPAYCVLDDDYSSSEFPSNTPTENLQVTVAHEFFHAVQFAYDVDEDWWFLEGTAAWVEDEIFDRVDDNRYYLRYSPLHQPRSPLDRTRGLWIYGSWIWWRFLTDQPGLSDEAGTGLPVLVREVWNRAGAGDGSTQSLQALREELTSQGSGFPARFAAFGVANRQPAAAYEEGAAYRRAPLRATHNLSASRRDVAWQSFTLDHLTNDTVAVRPASGYQQRGWKLRLVVDLPSTAKDPLATARVFRTDGSTRTTAVELRRDGTGSVRLPFSSRAVDRIELTLTNAGLENRLGFRYQATSRR